MSDELPMLELSPTSQKHRNKERQQVHERLPFRQSSSHYGSRFGNVPADKDVVNHRL
jgi:hypothetical protein